MTIREKLQIMKEIEARNAERLQAYLKAAR